MKLMFYTGYMKKGGAERVMANLCNELILNHEIYLVTTVKSNYDYFVDSKVEKYTLDEDEKIKSNIIVKNIHRMKRLFGIIKKCNPDVIISFLPEPNFRVLLANIFLKKKVIISVRNNPEIEYKGLLKKILVKILYTKSDGYVFQTEEAKKYFSKKIQDKSIIIPNPINSEFLIEPFKGTRKKEIVAVGRLVQQKNHKLLIDAFSEIEKKYPDYILKIYGEGGLEKELKEYTKNLKLEDKVLFMGNSDNIKNEIYNSAMFILSSDYEGMPNALMEALALGIPCISTDCPCGGPRMLIENNITGVLVKVGNKKELVDSIEKLILDSNFANKIGNAANQDMKKYDIKEISNIWLAYINKINK